MSREGGKQAGASYKLSEDLPVHGFASEVAAS